MKTKEKNMARESVKLGLKTALVGMVFGGRAADAYLNYATRDWGKEKRQEEEYSNIKPYSTGRSVEDIERERLEGLERARWEEERKHQEEEEERRRYEEEKINDYYYYNDERNRNSY